MAYTTIDDPSAYFQVAVYTGNGNDDKSIPFSSPNFTNEYVGQEIQGDLFIVKRTDSGTDHWDITDTVRGVGKQLLFSTAVESSESNCIKTVSSNGMTLGTNPQVNRADEPYICYIWKAGTTASASESGSNLAYSRSINTTSKFMISAYTGTGNSGDTLAHGLGSAPKWFMCKNRTANGWSWYVYHGANTSAPETDNLYFNNDDGTLDAADRWDDTAPSGTELAFGDNGGINADANSYMCYAWGEVQGYSKFGTYTGNNNTDGPFVYLGFKPAWIFLKKTSGTADWQIRSYVSDVYNEDSDEILMSSNNDGFTTSTNNIVDFLSNGFKLRGSGGDHNGNDTFVYGAFARHPFVTSKGIPVPAQ